MGKANEVPEAIRKGIEHAKKHFIRVSLAGTTIPHQVIGEFGAGRVLMRPATKGTGIIAGGAVRSVMEVVGIGDILTKSLGSNNPHNVVKAALAGLQRIREPQVVARMRGQELAVMQSTGASAGR
jgi:small subunit ribosomal protein S5